MKDLLNEDVEDLESVPERISTLVDQYEFPIGALMDVQGRLRDNDELHYASQQLRYLIKLVKTGKVKKRS